MYRPCSSKPTGASLFRTTLCKNWRPLPDYYELQRLRRLVTEAVRWSVANDARQRARFVYKQCQIVAWATATSWLDRIEVMFRLMQLYRVLYKWHGYWTKQLNVNSKLQHFRERHSFLNGLWRWLKLIMTICCCDLATRKPDAEEYLLVKYGRSRRFVKLNTRAFQLLYVSAARCNLQPSTRPSDKEESVFAFEVWFVRDSCETLKQQILF